MEVVKKRSFHGQADWKDGGWGSAPSALTVTKCENVYPFLTLKEAGAFHSASQSKEG